MTSRMRICFSVTARSDIEGLPKKIRRQIFQCHPVGTVDRYAGRITQNPTRLRTKRQTYVRRYLDAGGAKPYYIGGEQPFDPISGIGEAQCCTVAAANSASCR